MHIVYKYCFLCSIPLALLQILINELMKLTVEGDIEEIKTSVSDYSSVGEEALFSLQLFHRWYIIYMISVFKFLLIYNHTCKIKKILKFFTR